MDALGLAQPPMRTTHIGGQDSSRQQLLIVDRNTLACVTNTQLILYKIGSFPPKCEADLLTPSNAPCLRDPYVLHSSNTFEDDGGISAVAIDNDHELIAVCGRSIGKPASKQSLNAWLWYGYAPRPSWSVAPGRLQNRTEIIYSSFKNIPQIRRYQIFCLLSC